MPDYTGQALQLGALLANALALPRTLPQQYDEAQTNRALLQALATPGGAGAQPLLTSQQVNEFAPLLFR